jgi:hypothetical protein
MNELDLRNKIADGHVALRIERDKRRFADSRVLGPFISAARKELISFTNAQPAAWPEMSRDVDEG